MEFLKLKWLSGSWICKAERYETEELWQRPKANLMLGLNRTVSKEGKTAFEFLRIFHQNDEIIYAASPNGRSATLFKLTDFTENRVVFENPEHDFPSKITYTFHAPNKLTARIEGVIDGKLKSTEWKFKKIDN